MLYPACWLLPFRNHVLLYVAVEHSSCEYSVSQDESVPSVALGWRWHADRRLRLGRTFPAVGRVLPDHKALQLYRDARLLNAAPRSQALADAVVLLTRTYADADIARPDCSYSSRCWGDQLPGIARGLRVLAGIKVLPLGTSLDADRGSLSPPSCLRCRGAQLPSGAREWRVLAETGVLPAHTCPDPDRRWPDCSGSGRCRDDQLPSGAREWLVLVDTRVLLTRTCQAISRGWRDHSEF